MVCNCFSFFWQLISFSRITTLFCFTTTSKTLVAHYCGKLPYLGTIPRDVLKREIFFCGKRGRGSQNSSISHSNSLYIIKMRIWLEAVEKEMATHSSVLAWRIPGKGEPGGLPSMGSHRVGQDWSDLAAAAKAESWDPGE